MDMVGRIKLGQPQAGQRHGQLKHQDPAPPPPQPGGVSVQTRAAERERAEAEREAVEYQTQVAQMRIAGNFCADERKLTEYAYLYLKREPLPLPPRALSMEQARCASRTFLKGITPSAGRIVGYKSEQMPMMGEDGQQKMGKRRHTRRNFL